MRSVIIGAGTYGEVYLAYLQEAGIEVIGFLDDDLIYVNREVRGIPVLGGVDLLENLKETHDIQAVYCPLGNNKLRVRFLTRAAELGYAVPNFIHSSVIVSPGVEMASKGVYILLDAKIMPYTIIEDYVMISMGANIAHHSKLSKGVFISTGVNFGASIVAFDYAYIGISATIMTGVKELGKNCLVGAGAVVTKNVAENAVVAGVPAKVLKYRD